MPTFSLNENKRPVSAALLFLLILALAASLRFIGIGWGIPTSDIPHLPFHPDEVWVMDNLKEIHLEKGDWNPETAHAEGTFSYFLWTGEALLLKELGIITEMPGDIHTYNRDYARILLAGRVVTAFIDLLSLLFIYLTLRCISKNKSTPLIGALIFALIPYEVIHSHYMRGHIIANFFEVLVIYFSFRLYEMNGTLLYSIVGFFSALAAATRYQMVVVLILPVLVHLQKSDLLKGIRDLSFPAVFRSCVNWKVVFLVLCFTIGICLGLPFLFLDFASAKPHLQYLASYTAESEFSLGKLFDLSRVWIYVNYLIPYGTLPGLWVIFYFSLLYLLFQRKLYRFTLPLIAYIACYLYPMAKGYFATPIFIRAAIPLFPPFAILSALAVQDIEEKITSFLVKRTLAVLFCGILISTALYDFSYVLGMKRDPRIRMYQYFTTKVNEPALSIGLFPSGHSYFLTHPTLDILKDKQVTYFEKEDFLSTDTSVDYIVLSAFEYRDYDIARQRIEPLIASKKFVLEKTFETPLTFLGITFHFLRNPHDLQYPFPTFYILKRQHHDI